MTSVTALVFGAGVKRGLSHAVRKNHYIAMGWCGLSGRCRYLLYVTFILLGVAAGCGGGSSTSSVAQLSNGGNNGSGGGSTPSSGGGAQRPRQFVSTGGGLLAAAYDPTRGLLFLSNFFLNEVDVVSTTTRTLTHRIPIQQPLGIALARDSHSIVVGSGVQAIYLIDEDSLAVTRVAVPNLGDTFSPTTPVMPLAMKNGTFLFVGHKRGADQFDHPLFGEVLLQWNPTAQTVLLRQPSGTPGFDWTAIGPSAASGDGRYALISSSTIPPQLALYSSDNDSFTVTGLNQLSDPNFVQAIAANSTGTVFAVCFYDGQIHLYDQALRDLKTVVPGPGCGPSSAPILFSPDDRYIYILGGAIAPDSYLAALDTQTWTVAGVAPSSPGLPLASDGKGTVFSGFSGGLKFEDVSKLFANATPGTVFLSTPVAPSAGALSGGTSVVVQASNMPTGTKVFFGGYASPSVTVGGGPTTAITPSGPNPGPVDVSVVTPDGWSWYMPETYSYGSLPLQLTFNASAANAQSTTSIIGYGLGSTTGVQVSGPGTLTSSGPIPGSPLGQATVKLPVASPGVADVTVTTSFDSHTMPAAYYFLPAETVVSQPPGGVWLVYDQLRHRAYCTRAGVIDVLDPQTLTFNSPLTPAGTAVNASFGPLALSPDGSKLLAIDWTNSVLIIFDPDHPDQAISHTLRDPNVAGGPPAGTPAIYYRDLAVTSNATALIDDGPYPLIDFDLSTNTYRYRSDTHVAGPVGLARDSSGSTVAVGSSGNTGGVIAIWRAASDSFAAQGFQQFIDGLAMSADGHTIAAMQIDQVAPQNDSSILLDDQLNWFGVPVYPDFAPVTSRADWGVALTHSGKLYVVPRQDAIEVFDVSTGTLRLRIALPEPLLTPQNVAVVKHAIVLDDQEENIFVLSASGITVIRLPVPLEQMF